MIKRIGLIMGVFATFAVTAQKTQTTTAIIRLRDGDMVKAHQYIDEALEAYKELVSTGGMMKSKDEAKFWYTRADIYFKINSSKDSAVMALSDRALDESKDALLEVFRCDDKGTYMAEAEELFRFVTNGFLNRAFDAIEAERWADASKDFETAYNLKLNEHFGDGGMMDTATLYNAALMAQYDENWENAIRLNKALLPSGYNEHLTYLYIANYFKKLEMEDSARFYVDRGIDKYPGNRDLLIERTNFFINAGDSEGALKSLEEAIVADPENAILHSVYGTILMQMDRSEEANEPLLKAISLDTTLYESYYSLGVIRVERANGLVEKMNAKGISDSKYKALKTEQKSHYEEALPYFERALEIEPDDLLTIGALKKVYYQLGMSVEMKAMMDLEKELTGE